MKQAAGLLVYRWRNEKPEVFLVHPGGPFWKNKDDGAWVIPKGEFTESEDPFNAARREFREETGQDVDGTFTALPVLKQKGGKIVHAWAVEAEPDAEAIRSNTFPLEWPPKSGRFMDVPEVDRASWFDLNTARRKMLPSQLPLLDALEELLH